MVGSPRACGALWKDRRQRKIRRFDRLKALSLSKGGRREHHPYGMIANSGWVMTDAKEVHSVGAFLWEARERAERTRRP